MPPLSYRNLTLANAIKIMGSIDSTYIRENCRTQGEEKPSAVLTRKDKKQTNVGAFVGNPPQPRSSRARGHCIYKGPEE